METDRDSQRLTETLGVWQRLRDSWSIYPHFEFTEEDAVVSVQCLIVDLTATFTSITLDNQPSGEGRLGSNNFSEDMLDVITSAVCLLRVLRIHILC